MTSVPRFSVVVPTYGRSAWLEEAVDSVLRQTETDWECIVVDDGSPDAPSVAKDPRVRLVRRDRNGGAAAARNTGIDHATGRWVTFLDDDDVYRPDRLSRAREAADERTMLVSWTGAYENPDGPARTSRVLDGDVSGTILEAPVPHVGTVTIPRRACVRFDERFRVSEDVEWWLRQAAVVPVRTLPEVGYLLRSHDGPRQTARTDERLRCRLLLLDLHADYFARRRGAAAYQWKRAGGLALATGDRRTARRAFARSLLARPGPRTAAHLARALAPA